MQKEKNFIGKDRRTGDLDNVGAVVMPLARKILGRKAFAEADVLCNWKEIVGEEMASFSTPLKIDFKKTLKISEVSSPISKTINNTPYPYIEHIGPSKKPLLTNLLY